MEDTPSVRAFILWLCVLVAASSLAGSIAVFRIIPGGLPYEMAV